MKRFSSAAASSAFVLVLSAVVFISGCGMWSGGSAPAPDEENASSETAPQAARAPGGEEQIAAPSRAAKAAGETETSTVEVLWQVPGEAVEKYHLYYGLEPDELSNHIEVPVAELEKIDHPKHGPVYRYELKNIPAKRAIYLSLRAENKYGMSDPSPATKVEPGQKVVTP